MAAVGMAWLPPPPFFLCMLLRSVHVFLTWPRDFSYPLSESSNIVSNLLDVLPDMFKSNRTVDTSLGLALEAGFQVMGNIGGKMCVFQSGLPSSGKGSLRPRENPSALGTSAENKLLAPVSDLYYKTEAIKYSRQQICVEMLVAASSCRHRDT